METALFCMAVLSPSCLKRLGIACMGACNHFRNDQSFIMFSKIWFTPIKYFIKFLVDCVLPYRSKFPSLNRNKWLVVINDKHAIQYYSRCVNLHVRIKTKIVGQLSKKRIRSLLLNDYPFGRINLLREKFNPIKSHWPSRWVGTGRRNWSYIRWNWLFSSKCNLPQLEM